MGILDLKSIIDLKATNSPLTNQQLIGISEKVVDKQSDNPLFKHTNPQYAFKPPFGAPRNINAPFLRELSKNPYIFSIIKALQDEAASTKWDIVPKEGYEITDEDEKQRQYIKNFFLNPNSDNESFSQILRKLIWDISVLDSGVLVKVYNKLSELCQLRVIDGASVNKNPDMHGVINSKDKPDIIFKDAKSGTFQIPKQDTPTAYKILETQYMNTYDTIAAYYQFSTTVMNAMPIPFGKKEICYIMQHPSSSSVYSVTSPVQAAVDIVLSLIFGAKYHLDYFMNGNGPEGIISIPGANQMMTDTFKEKLNATIMTGRDQFGIQRRIGHRLPVVGNENVSFTPLTFPSKDMEIIEQQQWFTKILWMQFGVTPSMMGFTEDASKNVDINQSRLARRKGVRPMLENIAYHLNTQIIPELDKNNMFEFRFDETDIDEEIKKRTLQEQEIRMGLKSWQMIAEEEGININRLKDDKQENQEQEFQFSNPLGLDESQDVNQMNNEREEKEPKQESNPNTEQKSTTTDSGGQGLTDTPLVPVESKPMGQYANFESCVRDQMKKGKSEESANKICGYIKKQTEGKAEIKAKDISLDDIMEEVAAEIEQVGEELVKKTKEKDKK